MNPVRNMTVVSQLFRGWTCSLICLSLVWTLSFGRFSSFIVTFIFRTELDDWRNKLQCTSDNFFLLPKGSCRLYSIIYFSNEIWYLPWAKVGFDLSSNMTFYQFWLWAKQRATDKHHFPSGVPNSQCQFNHIIVRLNGFVNLKFHFRIMSAWSSTLNISGLQLDTSTPKKITGRRNSKHKSRCFAWYIVCWRGYTLVMRVMLLFKQR